MEQTPRTGFNILLMVEAVIAICVVLAGIVWAWSSIERRVTALEDQRREDAQRRDAGEREKRIDRLEQALREQQKLLEQMPRSTR